MKTARKIRAAVLMVLMRRISVAQIMALLNNMLWHGDPILSHNPSEETIFNAIRIGEYFKMHALQTFGLMAGHVDINRAPKKLLSWVRRGQKEEFTLRDAHQALQGSLEIDEIAMAAVTLAKRGYLQEPRESFKQGVGRKPSPRYLVNPKIHSRNSHNYEMEQF